MEILTSLIAFLGLITTSLAAPLVMTPDDIDTATCHVSFADHKIVLNYDVVIGRPFYFDGAGCDGIYKTLVAQGADPIAWSCNGEFPWGTAISFTSPGTKTANQAVLEGLQEAYPMVPFHDQQICFKDHLPDTLPLSTIKPRFDPLPVNTATCLTSYASNLSYVRYWVRIGEPFIDGAGCNAIYNTIGKDGGGPSFWKCEDDGTGDTYLTITTIPTKSANQGLISGLSEAYPMVPSSSFEDCFVDNLPDSWPPL